MAQKLDFQSLSTQDAHNYYHLDPTLQWIMQEYSDDDNWDLFSTLLDSVGELTGGDFASRAKENDEIGAKLVQRDINGHTVNDVQLPPGAEASLQQMVEMGLMAVTVSEKYKGDEGFQLPYAMEMAFGHMISQADAALYLMQMLTTGVANTIERFGSDELKEKYLPRICDTDPEKSYLGAMLLTEYNAGSDVGGSKATAVQDGDAYRISGTKMFITTPQSDVLLTLARPQGAPEGTKGLGLFLIPKHLDDGTRNSYTISKLEHKMGINASATAEIVFDGALGYPVGDVTAGFKYMLMLMNISRLKIGIQSLGIMRRALIEAGKYAATREQFGISIDHFPMVRELLVQMTVDTEATTHLCLRNAHALDRAKELREQGAGEDNFWAKLGRILTPMSKLRASDLAVVNASRGIQVHGGYGYIKEYHAEQLLRDAQICTLYEGTNEIQALDVMRSIAREQTLEAFIEDIDSLLASVNHDLIKPYVARIKEGVSEIRDSAAAIQNHTDKNYGQLVAKRFVTLLADVYTSTLIAWQAQKQIDSDNDARGVALLHCALEHMLPEADHGRYRLQGGDVSAHGLFDAVVRHESISPEKLAETLQQAEKARAALS